MHKRKSIVFVLLLVGIMLAACGGGGNDDGNEDTVQDSSQDAVSTQHPLMQLLALVPDTQANRAAANGISYMDYKAIVAVRFGAAQPTNWPEYTTLKDSADLAQADSVGLWWAAIMGVNSGPHDFMTAAFRSNDEIKALIGIDFFNVSRGLAFGQPPAEVVILAGSFDETAISTAYSNRGYSQQGFAGMTLWCGPVGCDSGDNSNINNVNHLNPFGGKLGREQAVLVSSNYMISSPSFEMLNNYDDISKMSLPTLANNANFYAAASAITETGTLVQAQFYDPILYSAADPLSVILGENATAESLELARANFVSLPRYSLIALADIAVGSEQIALITLVYDDLETAQVATEVLSTRISNYQSLGTVLPLTTLLAEQGIVMEAPRLYNHADTSKSVVVIIWRAPMPTHVPDATISGRFVHSSAIFKLLVSMNTARDLGWLAVGLG